MTPFSLFFNLGLNKENVLFLCVCVRVCVCVFVCVHNMYTTSMKHAFNIHVRASLSKIHVWDMLYTGRAIFVIISLTMWI